MHWLDIGLLILIGLAAGAFGAMMGVGGGIFVVPLLTLAAGIPLHAAIAMSLIAVAGTGCSSVTSYIKARFTNVRLGVLLETTTTAGALAGAFLGMFLSARWLSGIFAVGLVLSGYFMFRNRNTAINVAALPDTNNHNFATSLQASYRDPGGGGEVRYCVIRVRQGLCASAVAGAMSGLLGIGGGVIQVPVMNLVMGLPIKAAIGTSNFMIGITAVASAFVYYVRGYVDLLTTAPVLVGIFLGAQSGVVVTRRVNGNKLRLAFSAVLVCVAVLMLLRAVGVNL
ncbi:MAG: sulfite exporter TauE/SafE family protein [Chloroflexi bacterium]|nr:sulfite exporter TauE/SafE family protein [Chloroflexota bacterium]